MWNVMLIRKYCQTCESRMKPKFILKSSPQIIRRGLINFGFGSTFNLRSKNKKAGRMRLVGRESKDGTKTTSPLNIPRLPFFSFLFTKSIHVYICIYSFFKYYNVSL